MNSVFVGQLATMAFDESRYLVIDCGDGPRSVHPGKDIRVDRGCVEWSEGAIRLDVVEAIWLGGEAPELVTK